MITLNNRDNKFIDIAVGDDIVCGINFYGEVHCSESSTHFTGGTSFSKIDLPSERFAISIDGYNDHMCAILDDGSAMCWGDNLIGQLGDGTTTDSNIPVAVSLPAGRTATALALGNYHSCAILDDGSIHCWGYNGYGQLGDGTNTNSNTPVAVNLPAGRTATALALGWQHSCAILDDGSAMCWGDNDYGQLGDGTTTDSTTPVAVSLPAGSTATALALGGYHSCAILDDGSTMCWGNNDNGRLGDGTTTDSTTPVAVSLPAGRTATALALGSAHSCAILDDGSVHCSGYNYYGQLGDGTTTNSNTPVNRNRNGHKP